MGRIVIYADANVIIRLLEGDSVTWAPIESRLQPFRGSIRFLVTSRMSRLECRSKPLSRSNLPLLSLYDSFFASPELVVAEMSAGVVEKATELRAAYSLKFPDAIRLATAALSGATAFLTGDRALLRCTVVPIEIL